jgi:hypothetical protein
MPDVPEETLPNVTIMTASVMFLLLASGVMSSLVVLIMEFALCKVKHQKF